MSAARQPLSAVIITLNAASQIEACLQSAAFCEELLVVDAGSVDGTIELAERFGARVIRAEWRGFGLQKQFAIEQAKHDWVLCLDSDERITDALRTNIETELASPRRTAYRFPRCNRFMGRYLRHGEGYPDLSLRLFDRRRARWSSDAVHEKVMAQDRVGMLQGDLIHDSAESLEAYLAKQNRYTTLAAQEALARGATAGPAQLLLSPVLRFVKFYLLRLGLLDGLPGLVHVLIGCGNSFAKYAKMIDFQARANNR